MDVKAVGVIGRYTCKLVENVDRAVQCRLWPVYKQGEPWSAWTAANNLEAMSCTLWSKDPTLADVATERLRSALQSF